MAIKMSSREPLLPNTDEENNFYDRTHLLELPNARSTVRFRGPTAGTRLQIARTVNLCLSFFGLGLCFAIPNPTLEDLRKAANTDKDSIYYIYTARSCGYLLGAIAGGILFDRYNRQFLLFLSHLATAIGILVMPFCTELGALMACTAITGITMAFLDTGGNVWCLDLWGRKSAPVLQTLHFCFGLGAFVAPLVADPFLSPHGFHLQPVSHSINGSNMTTGMVVPPVGIHIQHPRFNSHSISHRILPDPPTHPGARSVDWNEILQEPSFHISKRSVPNSSDNNLTLLEGLNNDTKEAADTSAFSPDNPLPFLNQTESIASNNYSTIETNSSAKTGDTFSTTTESTVSLTTPKHRPKPSFIDSENLHKSTDKWERPPKPKPHAPAQSTKQVLSSTTSVPTATINETEAKMVIDDNITITDNYLGNYSDEDTTNGSMLPLSIPIANSSPLPSNSVTIQTVQTPPSTISSMQGLSTKVRVSSAEEFSTVAIVSEPSVYTSTSSLLPALTTIQPAQTGGSQSNGGMKPTQKSLGMISQSSTSQSASSRTMVIVTTQLSQVPGLVSDGSPVPTTPMNPDLTTVTTTTTKPGPVHRVKDATSHSDKDEDQSAEWQTNPESDDVDIPDIVITTKEPVNVPFSDLNDTNLENTSRIAINRGDDFFTRLYQSINQRRLGKFEFVYVILGTYIFMVAIIFLVFLCLNPREPRSKQEEETDRSRPVGRTFVISMVVLLSLFLCLYTGIEVAVGQLLQTFATKEQLRLPKAYFLPKLFWGSFAFARFVSILLALKLRGFTMLVIDMVVCLAASILLVAGADKEEALLWIGIVILGLGLSSVFPTSIVWVERYIHVTNKAAATLILGTAVGEIAVPLVINRFIDREPMVLMYMTLVVSVLCFVTFLGIWRIALRYGEKYSTKPDRCLYQLANADDVDDVLEMAPAFPNNQHSWQPLKRKLERT